jgi:hypothetical protein
MIQAEFVAMKSRYEERLRDVDNVVWLRGLSKAQLKRILRKDVTDFLTYCAMRELNGRV